jgi:hypothetical protein
MGPLSGEESGFIELKENQTLMGTQMDENQTTGQHLLCAGDTC